MRETNSSKWMSRQDFNPITSGSSHRFTEASCMSPNVNEPYVMPSKSQIAPRRRDKAKEIACETFRVKHSNGIMSK